MSGKSTTPRKRTQQESIRLIASMLKQGATKEQMAKYLNVKVSSLSNWMSPARKLAFPVSQAAENPAPHIITGRSSEPLPHMNTIAINAMWKGLERWRNFA
ncbi:hypothetical protein [Acetobacter sp. P5B1]|uniref:hypothetical protein n=1 Tax=Acetobacter sp. P5B1 TaxID=2762620 RepID=UPI001C05BBE3|nr:hypothetical protein [Acetobacter sp. P5B1]